ncbi:hypothetical protein ABXT43_04200 [Candidatus Pelagibacter sp. Uisw_114]
MTKKFFNNNELLIDISDSISEGDFTDAIHITQSAKNIISQEIFKNIYPYIINECK